MANSLKGRIDVKQFSLDNVPQLSLHVQDFVVRGTGWPVPHSYCILLTLIVLMWRIG